MTRWLSRPPGFFRRAFGNGVVQRGDLRLWVLSAFFFIPGCGSSTWLLNGLVDPTQQGNFLKPVNMEIRSSMTLLEEPLGIQDAEEPSPDDAVVVFEEPRISPGDFIRITIFELLVPGQATEQQILVSNTGYETLQVLGPTRVSGFTVRELELELAEKLRSAGILDEAEVQVSILRSEGAQYTVIGQVRQPGNYPLPRPNYRLLNVIGAVGGIPNDVEKIYVFREGGQSHDSAVIGEAEGSSSVRPDHDPIPFTMSDVSNGPSSSRPSTRPGTMSGIDELEILEGRPRGERMLPEYDPSTGSWVVRRAESQPAVPSPTGAQEGGDQVMERVLAPRPAPSSDQAGEVQPGEELKPAVRVIEIPAKLLLAGDPRYNIVVRPHDLINVPAGVLGEYYLFGNVARPGAYNLTGRRLTVKQALAAGGGFSPLAMPSRADLVRRVSKDEEQTIQIDLDAIFAGKAPDFYLRPNDIINVGSSPINYFLAVLRNAFRLTYGFGFVYDRNFADSDTFQAREQVRTRRRLEAQARGIPFN
ncbi:MAG: SLBB domain-containing protein [Phycisphaerales bacterium]|nr:SLBB domain-containing protein [Phycisphaerales bacterium]